MKKLGILLGTATLLAAMSSCSKSELSYYCDCGQGSEKASAYLQITGVDKDGYVLTRTATEKNSFASGDAIGIWVEDATTKSGYDGTAYDNIKLTNTNGKWNLATTVPLTATKAKVYALYPYNENMTDKTVTLSSTDAVDYLYDVKEGISSSNTSTGLSMKHIRSLLVVNIKKGNYAGKGVLSSSSISGSGLTLDGTYSLSENKFTQSENATKTLSMTAGTIPASGSLTDQWFVFTWYGAALGKLSFDLTIDGVAFKRATSKANVAFEPGKKYIFDLTLSKDYHVEVSEVQVEAWSETDEDVTVTDK